jgi:hypothetical protein
MDPLRCITAERFLAESMADVKLMLAQEEAADAAAGRLPFGALEVTESSYLSAGLQMEETQCVMRPRVRVSVLILVTGGVFARWLPRSEAALLQLCCRVFKINATHCIADLFRG